MVEKLEVKWELVELLTVGEESITKAQLRLTDIAENLESDWVKLAEQLGVTPEEVQQIQHDYQYVVEQVGVAISDIPNSSLVDAFLKDFQRLSYFQVVKTFLVPTWLHCK